LTEVDEVIPPFHSFGRCLRLRAMRRGDQQDGEEELVQSREKGAAIHH
jgi:hypothetical protein